MASINLITRHSGESYGAVLQTYATCMILHSLGHQVTIINLMEKDRLKKYFRVNSLLSYPKFFNFWMFKKRYYPNMTRLMTSIEEKKIPTSDYTIVGSDQVWNPQITKENKLSYFLDFAHDTIKLSLASSFGRYRWEEPEFYTKEVKKCLSDFSAVSVRETSGIDICRDVFNIDATCIVDPTIAWGKYDDLVKKRPKNQIACFVLTPNNPLFEKVVDRLSDKTKLEVLVLDYYSGLKYKSLRYYEKSPIRWLNEIYNSRIIITDSFHGVAFSLIFKKQFFVICADKKKFTRIDSLLKKVGLEERVVSGIEDLNERMEFLLHPIDYHYAEKVLEEERMNYFQFVNSNINEK